MKAQLAEREVELTATRRRLSRVVVKFNFLCSKVKALEAELGATNKSAKAAALFGAIGAATGVATLSMLFGTGESDDDEMDYE